MFGRFFTSTKRNCALTLPISARRHAEFRAERAVEVREIPESRVERDVQDARFPRQEARRRISKPCAQNELMRRHAGDRSKRSQVVKRALPRLNRELIERQRRGRIALDPPNAIGHATNPRPVLASPPRYGQSKIHGSDYPI